MVIIDHTDPSANLVGGTYICAWRTWQSAVRMAAGAGGAIIFIAGIWGRAKQKPWAEHGWLPMLVSTLWCFGLLVLLGFDADSIRRSHDRCNSHIAGPINAFIPSVVTCSFFSFIITTLVEAGAIVATGLCMFTSYKWLTVWSKDSNGAAGSNHVYVNSPNSVNSGSINQSPPVDSASASTVATAVPESVSSVRDTHIVDSGEDGGDEDAKVELEAALTIDSNEQPAEPERATSRKRSDNVSARRGSNSNDDNIDTIYRSKTTAVDTKSPKKSGGKKLKAPKKSSKKTRTTIPATAQGSANTRSNADQIELGSVIPRSEPAFLSSEPGEEPADSDSADSQPVPTRIAATTIITTATIATSAVALDSVEVDFDNVDLGEHQQDQDKDDNEDAAESTQFKPPWEE